MLIDKCLEAENIPCNVTAELHRDTNCHDKVDKGNSIESDVPPVHEGKQIDKDQDDHTKNDDCRSQIHPHQEEGHHKYCKQ